MNSILRTCALVACLLPAASRAALALAPDTLALDALRSGADPALDAARELASRP